jgi:4,5-dihydroxyphthalate decarboxylase
MSTAASLRLNILLGTYPKTQPLKSGSVKVAGAELEFAPIDDAMKGFKNAVRGLQYEVCELAMSTFLQAHSVGKPLVLLPFVMNGKFHHGSLLRRTDNRFTARELGGRKVAMRSYSQTTPTWVRGFLMNDYGVKIDQVKWLAREEGHVAEVGDPPWVSRMAGSKDLMQALLEGDVDVILSSAKPEGEDRVVTVIEDPAAAAREWADKYRAIPINHMVAVRRELAEERPDIVRAVYAALIESRRMGDRKPAAIDLQPYGFDQVQSSLELGIRYAQEQGLIPKPFTTAELYGPVRSALAGIA